MDERSNVILFSYFLFSKPMQERTRDNGYADCGTVTACGRARHSVWRRASDQRPTMCDRRRRRSKVTLQRQPPPPLLVVITVTTTKVEATAAVAEVALTSYTAVDRSIQQQIAIND
jgi:hypothetical protein